MAFIRTKRQDNRIYYYLVENRKKGKKVRQKVTKYLGTEPLRKEEIKTIRRSKDESHRSEAIQ